MKQRKPEEKKGNTPLAVASILMSLFGASLQERFSRAQAYRLKEGACSYLQWAQAYTQRSIS